MENSWNLIILSFSVIFVPILLIVILADRFSGPSIKTTLPKINNATSEIEENHTSMNHISPKLKPRLIILALCITSFLFFGFKENGKVYYYGSTYTVGSVFSPKSYTTYGLFQDAEDELNSLVAQKRNASFAGVLASLVVGGIISYSLWNEDEFKDLLIELRKA
ncbi:adhesin [Streptococcus suis]